MMTLLSIQMIPKVPTGIEPSDVVDKIIAHIARSGLKYEVSAMETTIEGPLDQLLSLVKALHIDSIGYGAERVISNMRIDYRPDGITIAEKLTHYR